ncbi:hypothetical protein BH18ACI4_BH18ACI4_04210 [soil metagenome]
MSNSAGKLVQLAALPKLGHDLKLVTVRLMMLRMRCKVTICFVFPI